MRRSNADAHKQSAKSSETLLKLCCEIESIGHNAAILTEVGRPSAATHITTRPVRIEASEAASHDIFQQCRSSVIHGPVYVALCKNLRSLRP